MTETVALSDVAISVHDGPFGSNLKSSHYVDRGVRVVRLQNIGVGYFDDRDRAFVADEHFARLRKHECRAGDVLIATLGDPIIRACRQPPWLKIALNKADCLRLECDPDRVVPEYVVHFLNSHATQAQAKGLAHGQTRPRVNLSQVRSLRVPLPPLDEQRRLAHILDAADQLRTARRESVDVLRNLLAAQYLELFGDPSTNTHRFPVGTVGDIVASAHYGSSAKAGVRGRYPILRMGNLTVDGRIDVSGLKYLDLDDKDVDRYLAQPGDVLFNRTNSPELVGKTAVYRGAQPMAYAGYLIRVRMADGHSSDYLSGFLNSSHGKRVLRGMAKAIIGMANINARELRAIRIPIPPVALQARYAAAVTSVRAQEARLETHLRHLDALFESIQDRAFTGGL